MEATHLELSWHRVRAHVIWPLLVGLLAAPSPSHADINFSDYHTPAEMEAELDNLAATHPDIAKVVTIGTSVEKRPIKALKISDFVNVDDPNKGDVVFVALHHARSGLPPRWRCIWLNT
jgi:hypothetical protein